MSHTATPATPATPAAHDLAAFIVRRLKRTDTLKLQKLMYYCNAWSLALRNRPIFDDQIEAWKHGPVVASIYRFHSKEPSVSSWKWGDAEGITGVDEVLANAVLDVYGAKSGWALRNQTHEEAPWINAWVRCQQGKRLHEVISHEEIRDFFKSQSDSA